MTALLTAGCVGEIDPDTASVSATGSPSTSSAASTQSRSTLTAPNLQPPPQEGERVNKDRPAVVFDPCTWISDRVVQEAGYDPASRSRGEDFLAEYTFLVCRFKSPHRSLSVMSGNVTLEEEREKNGSWLRPTSVNGREASFGRDPGVRGSCTVNMRTTSGVVFVNVLLNIEGRVQGADPCEGIEQTAALIETEIGEGN
ncbi:DUF3558 domain-containing protein [Nocardia brevicatena]|uniref:DUF3558 domain-containing protein n=1 Tax=Nocardia brevicatena TaxID=37327 RepID=UPI0012F791DE|nr:DUF3558 domain-containing protein [Nocardia brevicatena]